MKSHEIRDKMKCKIKGSFYSCSYYSERCKFVLFSLLCTIIKPKTPFNSMYM